MLHRFTGLAWRAVLVCALYWTVRLERADWLFVKGDAASMREAMRLAPGNAEYASALAEAEPARAVEILRDAVARNPLDGGLRLELGLAEEERGDLVQAEADLIEAERLDQGFAPRWAMSDFYFHRQEAEKFWPVVKDALNVSYGDVSAQFRQCWSLTGNAGFILERAIPDRPAVLRRYLDFLLSEGRLDTAVPVAQRVLARADREAAPSLVNFCDRMLADWRGEEALAIWNGLVERKLIAESGHGFDWRIAETPGIHVERAGDGWMLRFNGRQPESAEILSRYVPLMPGRRYRVSGCPRESGIECRLLVADGRDLADGATGNGNLGRLVLAYRREPGTTRIEGSIAVKALEIEADR
jgi:tetratricopeptide (TPR) repeat protein